MFAVIQTGGKQYKVSSNDLVLVEKLDGEPGQKVSLDVVAVGDDKGVAVGTPLVSGAKVTAEILSHGKEDKVLIFKKKRRQNYRRTNGHRQPYTALFITEISDAQGNKVSADAAKKPKGKAQKVEQSPSAKKSAAPVKKPAAAKKEAAPKKAAAEKKPAAAKKPAAKKAAAEKPAAEKKPAAKKTETKAKK